MRSQNLSLAALAKVARALGDALDQVVVVGAAAAATYTLGPLAPDIRATEDVDLVIEIRSRVEFDRWIAALELKGVLEHVTDKDAPICRYRLDGVPVDIMPIDASVLGFSNRWYGEALATSARFPIDATTTINVMTPLLFVATKIEAFIDPGRTNSGDYLASHDIEDMLTVLIGIPEIVDQIANGRREVHTFIRSKLRSFLDRPDFRDTVAGQFPSAVAAAAGREFLHRIERAASGD